jgi:hypothetical protein
MNQLPVLLIPAAISILCWWTVFSKSARQKIDRPAYRFWRLERDEQKEMYDGLSLALLVLAGIIFSLVTIGGLIAIIVKQ